MHACVVIFPGSNADTEMVRTLGEVCGVRTSVAWHTDSSLPTGVDLVAIPGGFSFGDYLRTGAIAKVSPVLEAIRAHAARGGYVLGVCNGFQILTEAGLLAGALTRNAHQRFECGDWYVRVTSAGPFTGKVGDVWRLPIAHGEGRFQADARMLQRLKDDDLIALRYCTKDGAIDDRANPNGSQHAIAGIYGGPRKNVLGLMPHPERMSDPALGGTDGRRLFDHIFSTISTAGH
jgi:phosphoribosylformylglycinamidine synthase subunit PurQ / glutaminase